MVDLNDDGKEIIERIIKNDKSLVICSDLDSDCDQVKDKPRCYLYNVSSGICPYLSEEGGKV